MFPQNAGKRLQGYTQCHSPEDHMSIFFRRENIKSELFICSLFNDDFLVAWVLLFQASSVSCVPHDITTRVTSSEEGKQDWI